MRRFNYLIGLCLFLLQACDTGTQQKKEVGNLDSISTRNLKRIIDTTQKGYPYEIIGAYLNNDTVQDYFVIDHSGISTGYFFDGKSGNEIPTNGVNIPWSRPGVELEYKIINVLCNDFQNEILVKGGSGGTFGLNLTHEVYRFDSALGIMKLVFQKDEFISHHNEEGNDVTDETNYIGLIYDKDSCNIKISIYKGIYKGNEIIPLKNSKKTIYHFNEFKNQFEVSQ